MAYVLVYADGSRQALPGRVGITRQDNDITKPDTVQAAFSTQLQLPDDVATHTRLGLPQVGTSLSPTPYQGAPCALEAGGVEVLPGARFALDDYTPRTGYTGRLLGGNKSFYDLLVKADGSDLTLRDLDFSQFDHDWTLGAVAAGAGRTRWQQAYCYDLYDRGLGAPPSPLVGSSRLYEAGYWPTAYARAVWEAVFQAVGVACTAELPAIFDQALLPATQAFGYSDLTRAAHQVVAGYAGAAQDRYFDDEQDDYLPFTQTVATKRDTSLALGPEAQFDASLHAVTITLTGYYDLKAEQTVHLYCSSVFDGEVSATVQLFLNGQPVGTDDSIRGKGKLDAGLTALAERQLLQVGDVVVARYKFDKWKNGLTGLGPIDYGWSLQPDGRLSVELLADFPPRGRVKLADWLPADLTCKGYVKGIIQLYGLTQTTDPYTGAVTFRRTGAHVMAGVLPGGSGVDWSARRDGNTPTKRSWRLGDLARRNWFRWKEDESNPAYQQAVFELTHSGLGWDADAAKAKAKDFAAGYLDNGTGDVNLDASKDVLTLPFGASPLGAAGLLLVPRWKPKPGSDYQADLQTIADALADGTYTKAEADAERVKALGDDFDTQEPQPRLCYRRPFSEVPVLLEDDQGNQQQVLLATSYFVEAGQAEDLDFTRSLLPAYYPHLAAALVRPLVLRPDVRLSAAEVVGFDQLVPVWLDDEAAWFWVNKVDGWEDGQPSTAVELVRLL